MKEEEPIPTVDKKKVIIHKKKQRKEATKGAEGSDFIKVLEEKIKKFESDR